MKSTSLKHFVLSCKPLMMKICLPKMAFPLSCGFLGKAQSTDVAILEEIAETKSLYSIQPFIGSGKTREIICYNGKIVVPKNCNQESSNGTMITLDILVSHIPITSMTRSCCARVPRASMRRPLVGLTR
jgi:hypothetical protein